MQVRWRANLHLPLSCGRFWSRRGQAGRKAEPGRAQGRAQGGRRAGAGRAQAEGTDLADEVPHTSWQH